MSVLVGYADWMLGTLKTVPLTWPFVGLGILAGSGILWRAFQIQLRRRL